MHLCVILYLDTNMSAILEFAGIDSGYDIYNPTVPFRTSFQGVEIDCLGARVEKRSTELGSISAFFRRIGRLRWEFLESAPIFNLQDPFVAEVHGELVFGGVRTTLIRREPLILSWVTDFYRGRSLDDLQGAKPFTSGPENMKGIRVGEYLDRAVALASRPQGEIGGRGKIGLGIIDNLDQLTAENILRAKLIKQVYPDEEWEGANQLRLLPRGKIELVAHKASMTIDGQGRIRKRYIATASVLDPATWSRTPPQTIAKSMDFPTGPVKPLGGNEVMVEDVAYPGGLKPRRDGLVEIYTGVRDTQSAVKVLPNPSEKAV